MKSPRAAFIYSGEIEGYRYPRDCPFKTERAQRTKGILSSMEYYTGQGRVEIAPERATNDELLLYHTKEYLDALKRVSSGRVGSQDLFMGFGTDDCPIFPDLYRYSVLAVGGSITAAKLILDGKIDIAFNPNGGFHHALPDKAGGFCYINDVVLACKTLANSDKKVLCLDLDAHFGNGTQPAFYDSSRVFTISFHESGKTLFPWGGSENEIGEGKGKGYNMNMPFHAGTDDDIYMKAFKELVPPLIDAFNPDVIVLLIGMDILSVDPLTHFRMTNNSIADIIPLITAYDKPILALGAGGYTTEDTARGWALCWTALCGIELDEDLNIGMGGVFLGSAEWNAGLRDKHIYLQGDIKDVVKADVDSKIEILKKTVFALHGI